MIKLGKLLGHPVAVMTLSKSPTKKQIKADIAEYVNKHSQSRRLVMSQKEIERSGYRHWELYKDIMRQAYDDDEDMVFEEAAV